MVKSTYSEVGNLALRRTTSIVRRVYSLLALIRLSIGRLVMKFFRYYCSVVLAFGITKRGKVGGAGIVGGVL